jgi:hypothetical protein
MMTMVWEIGRIGIATSSPLRRKNRSDLFTLAWVPLLDWKMFLICLLSFISLRNPWVLQPGKYS